MYILSGLLSHAPPFGVARPGLASPEASVDTLRYRAGISSTPLPTVWGDWTCVFGGLYVLGLGNERLVD